MRRRLQIAIVRLGLGLACLAGNGGCSRGAAKAPVLADCDGLEYCSCIATPGCQVKADGCLCPCTFGCPKGCSCVCGGGKYLGCQAAPEPGAAKRPSAR